MFGIRDLAKRILGQIDKALEFFGGSAIVDHADNGTSILQVSHPEPRPEGKTPGSTGSLLMIEDRTTRGPLFDTPIGSAVPGGYAVKSGLGDRDRKFCHRNGNSLRRGPEVGPKVLRRRYRLRIHERRCNQHQDDEGSCKTAFHEKPLPGNPTSLARKLSNGRDCGFARTQTVRVRRKMRRTSPDLSGFALIKKIAHQVPISK